MVTGKIGTTYLFEENFPAIKGRLVEFLEGIPTVFLGPEFDHSTGKLQKLATHG